MSDATISDVPQEIRDKRIAIARDVLLQLGRTDVPLAVTHGRYLEGTVPASEAIIDPECDLRDYADAVQRNCTCCALGAILISKARLYDGVPIGGFSVCNDRPQAFNVLGEECQQLLEDIFCTNQLDLIEATFEIWGRRVERSFGELFHLPSDRLAAIMQAIIDDNGIFDPAAALKRLVAVQTEVRA